MEHFKGFGLFNDVEDASLKAFNRARMLVNIAIDHSKNGKFNAKAVSLTSGYMKLIPKGERKAVVDEFVRLMKKEGFELGGAEDKKDQAVKEVVNG